MAKALQIARRWQIADALILLVLPRRPSCFMHERRYGLSEGKPNEKGIRMDAQLALDYITSHPALEGTKIVLYGQSIGGAVSVDLAASNPDKIAGIILENTFLSLVRATVLRLLVVPFCRSFKCSSSTASLHFVSHDDSTDSAKDRNVRDASCGAVHPHGASDREMVRNFLRRGNRRSLHQQSTMIDRGTLSVLAWKNNLFFLQELEGPHSKDAREVADALPRRAARRARTALTVHGALQAVLESEKEDASVPQRESQRYLRPA